MSWRRELKPVNILLLAGITFLLVAIIRIWWGGGDMPFQGPAAKGPEMPTAPILRDRQPLSAFKTVAAKSLFSKTRSEPGVNPRAAEGRRKSRQSMWARNGMGLKCSKYLMIR